MNDLHRAGEPAERDVWLRSKNKIPPPLVGEGRWHPMQCHRPESITFAKPQHAELRLADPGRIRQHGVEHRLQLTGRRTDDAENLGGRRLLL